MDKSEICPAVGGATVVSTKGVSCNGDRALGQGQRFRCATTARSTSGIGAVGEQRLHENVDRRCEGSRRRATRVLNRVEESAGSRLGRPEVPLVVQ